jgi:hypothetical protein
MRIGRVKAPRVVYHGVREKGKQAVPLHAMKALGGENV